MGEVRKRTTKKKPPTPEYKQEYGHGAGKLMRMRKVGITMGMYRELKK